MSLPTDTARVAEAKRPRRRRVLLGALAALALAACTQTGLRPEAPMAQAPATVPSGDVIGTGSTSIALLAPVSTEPGRALRNAAELAYRDSNGADVQILVKDTGGTAQGAQAAAQAAINEGARLILGPLFAQEVSAVGGVARAGGVPVVAFSTDTNVAARGVYLLSFQVDSEVDQAVRYATRQGRRSFAAIVPQSTYGTIAEASFQQAISRYGARAVGVERFSGDAASIEQAVGRVAAQREQIDAIFVPEGGQGLKAVLDALAAAGIDGNRIKLIGTGVWNEPATLADPRLQGAWFAGPAPDGFAWFSQRYQENYGAPPIRIASLSYDATRLAVELARQGVYDDAALLNANGFAGVDGIFRFRPDGTSERGLAVLEVRGGTTAIASPPPATFQDRLAAR